MERELKPIRQELLKHRLTLIWVGLSPALRLPDDIELVRLNPGRRAVDLPGMNTIGEDNQVAYCRVNSGHLGTPYREQPPPRPVRVTEFDSGSFEYRIGVRSHHSRSRRWLRDFPRRVVVHMRQGQRHRRSSGRPIPRQGSRVCIEIAFVGAPDSRNHYSDLRALNRDRAGRQARDGPINHVKRRLKSALVSLQYLEDNSYFSIRRLGHHQFALPGASYVLSRHRLGLSPQLRRVDDAKNHRNRDRQDCGEHQSHLLWQTQVSHRSVCHDCLDSFLVIRAAHARYAFERRTQGFATLPRLEIPPWLPHRNACVKHSLA